MCVSQEPNANFHIFVYDLSFIMLSNEQGLFDQINTDNQAVPMNLENVKIISPRAA